MHDFEKDLLELLEKNGHEIFVKDISDLDKEEFAAARHEGFGASDSSKLLGVNPFNSKEDLINEKVNYIHDEKISKKASVRKGAELEPNILSKAYNLLLEANKINKEGFIIKPRHMYGNKDNHLTVNFDGVLVSIDEVGTTLEAKLVTRFGLKYYDFSKAYLRTVDGDWDETYEEEPDTLNVPAINEYNINDMCNKLADHYGIPVYYFTQVQQQLYFLDKPFGYLAVQNDDTWETYIFKIYRHDDLIEVLKSQAKKTWILVEAKRSIKKERP